MSDNDSRTAAAQQLYEAGIEYLREREPTSILSDTDPATQRKRFDCDCGWAFHGLDIIQDDGEITITVVNSRHDLSFWKRVKMAWKTLLGNDHIMSEIILDRNQRNEFVNFVASLVHDPNTR